MVVTRLRPPGRGVTHATPAPPTAVRALRRIPWRFVVLTLGVILPFAWTWFARLDRPSDGTLVLPKPGDSMLRIAQVYRSKYNEGLQPGDIVTSVGGKPIGAVGGASRSYGEHLVYTVTRDGRTRPVAVTLGHYPFDAVLRESGVLLILVAVLLLVVGAVFAIRPRDPAARAMFAAGVMLPCIVTEYPLGLQVSDLAGGDGLTGFLGAEIAACLMWSTIVYFTFVFPEPSPFLRRHRWVGPGCYAVPPLLWLLSWSWKLPGAHTALARLTVFITPSALAALAMPFVMAVRLIVSYRGSADPDARRRLRWIGLTLVVGFAAYLLLGQLPQTFGSGPILSYQYLLLFLLPVPLAVAAGILRYRLFDIEVILTRSLLVGALTAVVAVMYVIVVVLLPTLGLHLPTVVALIVGSAIAIAAWSLRRALAARITRLVYGDRSDPHAVISQLSAVTSVAASETILPDVVDTLARTLRLSHVRLELLAPDGTIEASAEHGSPMRRPEVIPIGDGQDVLGRLQVDVGAGREPFGPADKRLLDDLSQQLVAAARTVALNRNLQRSRERLALAREEERRRLRRDLHDGVGPSLAAQAMQLDVAASLVGEDPVAAARLLERLSASTQAVLGDIRQIVEDLRPAALDQLGLVSSIREYARHFDGVPTSADGRAFWVDIDAPRDLGELPAAVEVAAFRVAIEAVTNAAKYSFGERCVVRIRCSRDELHLTVTDDGRGLGVEVAGTGVGIPSMRERAAELGGHCVIADGRDGGTVVELRLPLRPIAERQP